MDRRYEMKIKKYLFALLVILIYNQNLFPQDYNKPYVVNSFIGDTITRDERDNYILFTEIDGFNWAVLHLKPDSMLDAQVNYQVEDNSRDTLIKNYKSLKSFDYHIKAKYAMDTDLPIASMNESKNAKPTLTRGTEMRIFKVSGEEKYGELLSVRKSYLLMYKSECENDLSFPDCVWKENESEINKVIIEGNSNLGLGIGLGLIASVVAGAIIYFSNYDDGKNDGMFNIDFAHMNAYEKSITPIILSTISLTALGIIIGLETSTPDTEIRIDNEGDIQGLRKYARYQYEEPTQLKNIE
jgi:hypothetical protein